MSYISEAIYQLRELAFEKSFIEDKIKSKVPKITEHLIKCIIYKNSTNNLNGWISEIASYCEFINRLKFNNDHKLKAENYKNIFNGRWGTTQDDSKLEIEDFKRINCCKNSKDPYPNFTVTNQQAYALRDICDKLLNKFCKLWAWRNNKLTQKDFEDYIKEILSIYI